MKDDFLQAIVFDLKPKNLPEWVFSMLPFRHPTTVLVVDDDDLFLDSFSFNYGRNFSCRTTTAAHSVAGQLHTNNSRWLGKLNLFEGLEADEFGSAGSKAEHLVKLRRYPFAELASFNDRHDTISVVVVDYAMPSMSGVELCRQIRNLPAKKLLLTGKTGDTTAVAAFNEGIIDRFLVKEDPELPTRLPIEIKALKTLFFESAARPVGAAGLCHSLSFLADSSVMSFLMQTLEDRGAVEYFAWDEPAGVLMTLPDGKRETIILADADRMRAQREIAVAVEAPQEFRAQLDDNLSLAWFPTDGGFFDKQFASRWQNYTFPATEIVSATWWAAIAPANAFEEIISL